MNTCACGNPANGNGTTCHWCAALHELGLKAGATDVEIKAAHRLYVKAWHPDRFPGDEKSKNAAQEKLKSINSAYEFLTSPSSKNSQRYRPKASAPRAQPQEPAKQKQTAPPSAGARSQEPPPKGNTAGPAPPRPPNPPPPPYWQPWRPKLIFSPRLKSFLRYVAIVFALGVGKALWQTFDAKPIVNTAAQAEWDQQKAKAVEDLQVQMPNSGTSGVNIRPGATDLPANSQSGSAYDQGKYSYNHKQYPQARELFTEACNGGEMKACNYLGYLYAKGLGGVHDTEKARDIYQKACDQGTLSSCTSLGSLYQDAGNSDEARNYFQKACNGGVAESCKLLRGVQ